MDLQQASPRYLRLQVSANMLKQNTKRFSLDIIAGCWVDTRKKRLTDMH
jgi:hypothetical protein